MENKVTGLTEFAGITFKRPIVKEGDVAIVKNYIENGNNLNITVEAFPELTKKQIIGKLVAYGAYVKQEDPQKPKTTAPSKKDYIRRIENALGITEMDGLLGATKEALMDLAWAVEELVADVDEMEEGDEAEEVAE